ncbi:MAG: 3-isopropylmalate dehydratase small subunit [Methanoculleus sp.]|nr:3-isopropylmalate dehydratase small subunit [Methanoculleus sp.]MDD3858292.1 3-isopropylmalate dehydratase small subunit [Methanoculleus sp.]
MRAWKFGNDIDTDAIIPGRFLTIYDPAELAKHAFEGTRDEFAKGARAGDVVVGGTNFGCGSSREHAPLALLGAGIRVVIAASFARIFYRNAVNTGLLPLVCAGVDEIRDGDAVSVDVAGGFITVNGKQFAVEPVPGFLRTIVEAGGLVAYAKDLERVETCSTE